MNPTRISTLALLALCAPVLGQEQSFLSRAHAQLSAEANTGYYFRGLLQQDKTPVLQNSLELGYDLANVRGVAAQPFVGLWNSFSTKALATRQAGGTWDPWYELDLYAGLQLSTETVTFRGTFTTYGSPARAFAEFDDVTLSLAWTPKAVPIADVLAPTLTYACETRGAADGQRRGSYLEIGLQPTFDLGKIALRPTRIAVPIAAGFSLGRYFESASGGNDERFGFFDVGVELSADLYRVAKRGLSTVTLGVHRLELGDNAASYNGGDRGEWLVSLGITLKF